MNIITSIIFLLKIISGLCQDVPVSYDNFRVYEVLEGESDKFRLKIPDSNVKVLTECRKFDENLQPYVLRSYLIPSVEEKSFIKFLHNSGAYYNISVPDLGAAIRQEHQEQLILLNRVSSPVSGYQKEIFYSYDEMVRFLEFIPSIVNPYSGLPLAVVEVVGKSYEGRNIFLVKISSDHAADKPIIFFEACVHSREWTALSSALYTISQLTENYTYTKDVLENVDFYIIPLVNPDGYEYSRTVDRLWRKTRSVYRGYYGVDGNRNYDFHWGEMGSSDEPSSEVFRGPYPFSESETRAVRDAALNVQQRIKAFVSIHAYGPYIVFPWSYAKLIAPNTDLMAAVAQQAVNAIYKFSGTMYISGVTSFLMYEAAGGVDDYFKGVLGVDLSYTFELSPGGEKSFITHPSKLPLIVSEAFEGYKVIASSASKMVHAYAKKAKILHPTQIRGRSVINLS